MKDINNQEDIKLLVDTFYEHILNESKIDFFFGEVVHIDWDLHLPKMYEFWGSTILGIGNFSGNVMRKHLQINQKHTMKSEHFKEWLRYFHQTVDDLFEGNNAELAKQRATSIATVMQIKTHHINA